jgi:hypothetical protein
MISSLVTACTRGNSSMGAFTGGVIRATGNGQRATGNA